MPLFPNLVERRRQPELMDQPGLDRDSHFQALRGLERINRWSGSARILWRPLLRVARQVGGPAFRVLDIATGGGDLPVGLWRRATRAGLAMQFDAWDISPDAVDYARARAARVGADVRFFIKDALADDIPPDYDAVISSLFLHHLDEAQAVRLLRRMADAARQVVLINDLARSTFGLLLARAGTRLLSASRVVHMDGPRSVEGAFTRAEARALADKAGLGGARVVPRWPARFLLSWRRPGC
jgi:SAM-dependent methyltransferase